MTDIEIMITDYVDKIAELQKEKCELLGIIQAKDELIEKMRCCGNCGFAIHNRLDGTFCSRKAEYRQANEKCKNWELAEC